jgi:pyridoxine/pyridoxamine 5'-phosphate oxidase
MCAQELLVLDCQGLHQHVVGVDKFLDPFVLELPGHVREGKAQALDVSQDAARLLQILRFCRQVQFSGKIQKVGVRNAMTYRLPNSRKSNFATELSCPTGAPRAM